MYKLRPREDEKVVCGVAPGGLDVVETLPENARQCGKRKQLSLLG